MNTDKKLAQVFHFDLYGKRQEKYNFLLENNLQSISWSELTPNEPNYFFVPKDFSSQQEYKRGFLKIDFPRIPYPENTKQFEKLAAFGEKLRKLHLMEDITVPNNFANYPKTGSNKVENSFTEKSGNYRNNKVWINDTQYFDHVPETVWKFYIGGYQPAQKWLKDRKERMLSYEDIEHYQKIIFVLNETDKIMKKIDKISF
ncbi:MAG: hypothetical protein LBJ67_12405 [Planctomycetaceae bacterium]|jgi:predicted helicase|nr:hypothetical protein [Planctomycetaceae bacterium]